MEDVEEGLREGEKRLKKESTGQKWMGNNSEADFGPTLTVMLMMIIYVSENV